MSETAAGRASDTILPPTLTGTNPSGIDTKVTTLSTSGTAARAALTSITGLPKVYITLAAISYDVYVAFKLGTAAASVTTSTGWIIPVGQERSWWINPSQVNDLEYITGGLAGSLQYYYSSPGYESTV